jgi:membrane-bound lytic murein transglycosylase A
MRQLALVLFLANLNCVWLDSGTQSHLPPGLARLCTPESSSKVVTTPTRRLDEAEYPDFTDDLDFENMELALERQLLRFQQRNLDGEILFGTDRYPLQHVADSLARFLVHVRSIQNCLRRGKPRNVCYGDFANAVKLEFAVYVPNLEPGDPRYNESEPVLYTAYYTPLIQTHAKPHGAFRFPIYANPRDEFVQRMGRYMIDFRTGLAHRGLELFYADDLFELYLFHIEGGGRVAYVDELGQPQSAYLSYDGTNQRQWRFLSNLLIDKNWIQIPTVDQQRKFIATHPELWPEIFAYCPSYVFFKITPNPPEGSDSVPLTDNRSIATDSSHYSFKGALAYVKSHRLLPADKSTATMPFSRFVLDQDTGGAIKGKARVDFYFGEGEYARQAASHMKARGDLFFLMLKP